MSGVSFQRWVIPTDTDLVASDPKACLPRLLAVLSGLALFIIGCIAAAGHLTGPALAGSIIGLSGASFIFYLMTGDFKQSRSALIIHALATAVFMLIGTCGFTNWLYPVGIGAMVIVAKIFESSSALLNWSCSQYQQRSTGTKIPLTDVPEATEEELQNAQPAPMPKFHTSKTRDKYS